jgi:DnaJ-class molecular chaperone
MVDGVGLMDAYGSSSHARLRGTHTHMKVCPDCNGDGVVDKDTDDERQCPTCGGLGFVSDDDDGHEEIIKTSHDLPLKQTRQARW